MNQDSLGTWRKTHYSSEITPKTDGAKVTLMGWVRELRLHKDVAFVVLADREGDAQITILKKKVPKIFDKIKNLNREDVIAIKGTVKKTKQTVRGVEVLLKDFKLLNRSETPLPLEITEKTPAEFDTRLNSRVLDLRKPKNQAIFKIQSKLVEGMQTFLIKNDYIQVFTPCLLGATSEGGADMFTLPYFNKEAFLRQDPQLHRQLLLGAGFEKIFDLGPSWRAEQSHTTYHLCEHRGCAVELSFIKDETDTMRVEEQMVVAALKLVKKDCRAELKLLKKEIKIPKTPFPELRFPEIYNILKQFGKKLREDEDLNRELNILLWNYVKEKYDNDFFFVNRFPFTIKPFYVMQVDEDPKWARSVDLLYKGSEMSSGGQREHRHDNLIKNIKEKKINPKDLEWFTKFFKYGMPMHGGFNLGIERLTMALLDLPNIREATLFPRDPDRLTP